MLKKLLRSRPPVAAGGGLPEAVRQADEARDAGDAALAAVLYGRIVEQWGAEFGILVQHGNALKDSGAFEASERAYCAALELQPLDADCHLQLGHLMKLAGRARLALEYYEIARRLDPQLEDAQREIRDLRGSAPDGVAIRSGPSGAGGAPERIRVETAEARSRSTLMRERLTGSLKWRRD